MSRIINTITDETTECTLARGRECTKSVVYRHDCCGSLRGELLLSRRTSVIVGPFEMPLSLVRVLCGIFFTEPFILSTGIVGVSLAQWTWREIHDDIRPRCKDLILRRGPRIQRPRQTRQLLACDRGVAWKSYLMNRASQWGTAYLTEMLPLFPTGR